MIAEPTATELVAAAAALGDDGQWPQTEGEPTFAEPWEGRAFGLAFDVIRAADLSWQDFRVRLIEAIAEDPHRPYYRSWLIALERLAVAHLPLDVAELDHQRVEAARYRYDDDDLGEVEVYPLVDERRALLPPLLAGLVAAADHVELYRLDGDRRCGLRGFVGDRLHVDHVIPPAEWTALLHRVFAVDG